MTMVLMIAGLVTLVVGAELLVRGASRLAIAAGVSPLVVGLTVVAFGTSAPEMAASFGAALAGTADLALGNVVGSNLFNLTAVLGLAAVGSSTGVAVAGQALRVDLPVLVLTAVVCLPVFFTGFEVSRREGLAFLATMAAYLGWVVADALGRGVPSAVTVAVAAFGIAAVVGTILESVRQLRRSRRRG